MRVFIEYKRKGATTVYILQIFFPIAHQQKHPLPLLLFFFSFNKRSRLGFEIRKKNLGYQNLKMSSSSSKSAFETSHFISRRKEGQRANTPGFLSRPPTRSTPFLTAETLKVRRDSSNSFLLLLLLFLSRREESLVVLFKVVVSGVEGVRSLCRERLVFLDRYDDVDVDGGVLLSAVRRVDETFCEFERVFEKDDDVEFFSTRARDYWKEKYLEKNGTPRKGVRLCESKSRRRRRLRPNADLYDGSKQTQLYSGLGGQALNAKEKEFPTIAQVLAKIPKECFERSTAKSLMYAGISTAITLSVGLVAWATLPFTAYYLPAWIAYAYVAGTAATGCWVAAHECGHGAFSDNRTIQDTVGYILHSLLLVPYFSWQRSHAVHHSKTNHVSEGRRTCRRKWEAMKQI